MNAGLIVLGDKSKPHFKSSADKLQKILCQQDIISTSKSDVFNYFGEDWIRRGDSDLYDKIHQNVMDLIDRGITDVIIIYVGHGIVGADHQLYLSHDDTPVKAPDQTKCFCMSKLIGIDLKQLKINKWLFLDCCHSAAILPAIYGCEGNTVALCCSGSDADAKESNYDESNTLFVHGLEEILKGGQIKPLSINAMCEQIREAGAYKEKSHPFLPIATGSGLVDLSNKTILFHRAILGYPGYYFNNNDKKAIESNVFLDACSRTANGLIISHRTGSIHWDDLKKTTQGLATQLRKFCTNPSLFSHDYSKLNCLPPILVYVLEYPDSINGSTEDIDGPGDMKAIYNFIMLKTVFQTILMSPPNNDHGLSLLNKEISELFIDNNKVVKDKKLDINMYNELKLWHWFSYRCCFVVRGLSNRSKIFGKFNKTLRKLGQTSHVLIHNHKEKPDKKNNGLNFHASHTAILANKIPSFIGNEYDTSTNIKENLYPKNIDKDKINGFGLYSTILMEDVGAPDTAKVDFWKWDIVKKENSSEIEELSIVQHTSPHINGSRLVYLGALRKLLFNHNREPHNTHLELYNTPKFEKLKNTSIAAYNELYNLGFSVLNVAEFLSEPSFNNKFPNGKIDF